MIGEYSGAVRINTPISILLVANMSVGETICILKVQYFHSTLCSFCHHGRKLLHYEQDLFTRRVVETTSTSSSHSNANSGSINAPYALALTADDGRVQTQTCVDLCLPWKQQCECWMFCVKKWKKSENSREPNSDAEVSFNMLLGLEDIFFLCLCRELYLYWRCQAVHR